MVTKKIMNYLLTLNIDQNEVCRWWRHSSVQLLKHLTADNGIICSTHDDSDNEIDIYLDNKRVVTANGFAQITAAVSNGD